MEEQKLDLPSKLKLQCKLKRIVLFGQGMHISFRAVEPSQVIHWVVPRAIIDNKCFYQQIRDIFYLKGPFVWVMPLDVRKNKWYNHQEILVQPIDCVINGLNGWNGAKEVWVSAKKLSA